MIYALLVSRFLSSTSEVVIKTTCNELPHADERKIIRNGSSQKVLIFYTILHMKIQLSQSKFYFRCQCLPTWLPWQRGRMFFHLTRHRWQLVTSTERSTQLIQFVQECKKCEALGISAKSCQKQNSTLSSRCNKIGIAAFKY